MYQRTRTTYYGHVSDEPAVITARHSNFPFGASVCRYITLEIEGALEIHLTAEQATEISDKLIAAVQAYRSAEAAAEIAEETAECGVCGNRHSPPACEYPLAPADL